MRNLLNLCEVVGELCALGGPAGFEGAVTDRAGELLKPFVDEIKVDRPGNLIGMRRCAAKNAKSLMLAAHLDEIGLIITGYDEGYLRFTTIGGVDERMLPNRELTLLTGGGIRGVVTCLPPHVLSKEEVKKAVPMDKMFIDVGLSEDEARKKIPIGTPAVFAEAMTRLDGNVITAKALDNRLGFAVILRAAELLSEREVGINIAFVGTVQEELGTRGAITSAFSVAPDYAVAVDMTFGAAPDNPKDMTFELGSGAAIGTGPNINRFMYKKMLEIAEKHEIKHTIEVMGGNTGTDAWPIQISREGVATAIVSVPARYMHSPVETANLDDAEAAARLICEFACEVGKEGFGHD